ncbi:hypothetical protein ACO22_05556 [Paracoccidioides brasiliensis]|uniref:Uncharacterized protein n=1 Tax=Paracoccidioides brasiliensis TaxID=121759 RepID=A0A1D2JA36_PARBR|nr:hypothetical protein ACO22_05556 [Paracoccidioides brasiliensis]
MTEKFVGLAAFDEAGLYSSLLLPKSIVGGDIDVIIDPEHVKDREIIGLLRSLMVQARNDLNFRPMWTNDSVTLFLTVPSCRYLFADVIKQNHCPLSGKASQGVGSGFGIGSGIKI